MDETQSNQEIQQVTDLKPSLATYLRLGGVVTSDVIAVAAIYQSFDLALSIILSIVVVALTIIAAWYNNSITKGAVAADYMKDVFSDADNAETIKGVWKNINDAAHQIYVIIKEDKES